MLIAVRAFGVNHAETHVRKGEWAEYMPIIGIECVGEVVNAPGGEFNPGDKVAAFVGGLGRTLNGSYAEFTVAPATNVIKIETTLPWEEFAALPESYATAWVALNANLEIKRGQTLLLRGATSALGQAALNIAVDAGLNVIATTRKIVERVEKGIYKAKPAAVFNFDEIREAQTLMELNQANGKIVVKL